METKEKIKEILCKVKPYVEIQEDDELIQTMGIDSHDIFNIVVALEEAFNIRIEPTCLKVSNFSSLERIEKMICDIQQQNRGI